MMQAVTNGDHPGKASFHFLPMIDMDPTDMSCIFSTLHFISDENKRHGTTPVITFDQPLWWKSKMIITREKDGSDLKKIVLILGGFHTIMSFLGSIGHVMKSSGLHDVLDLVYAENAVTHMLSGKAYSRAVRGHFLVDTCLNVLVMQRAYDLPPIPEDGLAIDEVSGDLKCAVEKLDHLLRSMDEQVIDSQDKTIARIDEKIAVEKKKIERSPTGKLWVQYMAMVDILRSILRAQRTGNFMLYLHTLQKMLPFLAATGHSNYAKSVHLYLQDMLDLKVSDPQVFKSFISGLFVVRRSDRYWAGLPTDLIIEQVLMRALKTNGGLTRGRGMDEEQRTRWLLAMPACAEVNEMMQELTGTYYNTSEQHKEMTEARRIRDKKDTDKLLEFLQDHSPFENNEGLYNIATGVSGSESANPQHAEEVGHSILKKMSGQNAFEFSFRKKDQIETLGQKVPSLGENVSVDPQLLFQRLLIIANNTTDCTLAEAFKFELSAHPPALFDKSGLLREANKPQLAEAIATVIPKDELTKPLDKAEFSVLDGGSLLHRLSWGKGESFEVISGKYVAYVKKNFNNPVVVFDGYSNPTTKDATHNRRSKGVVGPKVHFTPNMPLKSKKESFLANSENKQAFIDLLSERLQGEEIRTLHAEGDADFLIAKTGVEYATSGITHVIGEDTDILVLLCHHVEPGSKALFFRSEKPTAKYPVIDICLLKQKLGAEVCKSLPFIHAICGCDTTSRLFGIGKGAALKKAQSDPAFLKCAKVFASAASAEKIRNAGEKALVSLYGGKADDILDTLRKKKFSDKVVKSISSVDVQTLPPTSDSAKYHSYRVYHQVQMWMGKGTNLNPIEWGWCIRGGALEPKTMDSSPAPECLLKVIRCKCKGHCENNKCSCKRHGLECTGACAECQDGTCTNIPVVDVDIEHIDSTDTNFVDWGDHFF